MISQREFPAVWITQVAVQGVAGHLIIKAQAVVAYRTGARLTERFIDLGNELRFRVTVLQRFLRGDAGNQAGLWRRQVVIRWLAVDHQRVFDNVQIRIRAHTGKLGGAVVHRVYAEGFVVVPVERADQRKTPANQ